jgi:hypothetical protein
MVLKKYDVALYKMKKIQATWKNNGRNNWHMKKQQVYLAEPIANWHEKSKLGDFYN